MFTRAWFGRKVALTVIAVGAAALGGCQPKAPPPPAPPAEVNVAPVLRRDERITEEWIGTLAGYVDADIRAQVSGYLLKKAYQEGTAVKKGDLLFQIDPRSTEAAYAQVKAVVDKANADLAREKTLVEKDAISKQEYDTALAAHLSGLASLQTAQLNLDFTRITSPIDGVAGIATAQIGDLVGPGSGVLTTVSTLDPIKVYFSISEQAYLDFLRGGPGRPKFPEGLDLQLILADGSVYPQPGKYFATDRQVDATTGTLRLVGVFPNPGNRMRPGQYGRVRAVVRTELGALEVPERAVSELQGAFQVATVSADNKCHWVTVQVGERLGGRWIISSGLRADDRVVVDGLQKARDGATVSPHLVR
jgi:membrane fusion protein (multidrug efflux system)